MKPIRFHTAANAEMMEAAIFYKKQERDLGKRFLSTVQNAVKLIQINPDRFPLIHADVRRCITKTFPFNVLFRITSSQIIVVAIMHQNRDPDYWKGR